MTVPADVLADLVRRVHDAPPRMPEPGTAPPWRGTRLVCVDGPAGSGKTSLATQLAVELCCQVVHMDDLYEGWQDGPDGGAGRLARLVLEPLAAGRPGEYRRYDWYRGSWAERHAVPVAPFLVAEGCGSAARVVDPWAALKIWVEADAEERLRRAVARDGEAARSHLQRWMQDEARHYAAEQTRARSDVHLDGFGRTPATGEQENRWTAR